MAVVLPLSSLLWLVSLLVVLSMCWLIVLSTLMLFLLALPTQ